MVQSCLQSSAVYSRRVLLQGCQPECRAPGCSGPTLTYSTLQGFVFGSFGRGGVFAFFRVFDTAGTFRSLPRAFLGISAGSSPHEVRTSFRRRQKPHALVVSGDGQGETVGDTHIPRFKLGADPSWSPTPNQYVPIADGISLTVPRRQAGRASASSSSMCSASQYRYCCVEKARASGKLTLVVDQTGRHLTCQLQHLEA